MNKLVSEVYTEAHPAVVDALLTAVPYDESWKAAGEGRYSRTDHRTNASRAADLLVQHIFDPAADHATNTGDFGDALRMYQPGSDPIERFATAPATSNATTAVWRVVRPVVERYEAAERLRRYLVAFRAQPEPYTGYSDVMGSIPRGDGDKLHASDIEALVLAVLPEADTNARRLPGVTP